MSEAVFMVQSVLFLLNTAFAVFKLFETSAALVEINVFLCYALFIIKVNKIKGL